MFMLFIYEIPKDIIHKLDYKMGNRLDFGRIDDWVQTH
jgi:hypothetical protein